MYDGFLGKTERTELCVYTNNPKYRLPSLFERKDGKNGRKKSGIQNHRCQTCGKQFQSEYLYWGAEKKNKELVARMLTRSSGIRDIADVLRISTGCILGTLLSYAHVELKSRYQFYHQVQVDELYSFVQTKQKEVWILYAYCVETKEILAVTMGKRSEKTVLELYNRLKDIQVNFWCTDHWEAFKAVFPAEK